MSGEREEGDVKEERNSDQSNRHQRQEKCYFRHDPLLSCRSRHVRAAARFLYSGDPGQGAMPWGHARF